MTQMELYRRLGRAVAARRNKLGLTQAQVAAWLGLTRASLANIESGRQRIMVHQLFRLVEALELKSILDLVPGSWRFDESLGRLEFKGAELTSKEKLGVQHVLRAALADDRGRRK